MISNKKNQIVYNKGMYATYDAEARVFLLFKKVK
jgi:hypothetical protein